MKERVLFLVALLCLALSCGAQKVGVKATVSWGGLAYLKDVGIDVLEQDLSSLSIPDISGTASTPIGSIAYTLSNIVLTTVSIPQSNVSLIPPSGISLDIENAQAALTMNWQYREDSWPHVSDSGTADVSGSSITIGVTIAIGEASGRPTATAASCSVDIGSLDITLHGGASWLYNLFINLFAGQIKSATESQLQTAIPQNINTGLANTLATLPIEEPINSKIEINYEMQAAPTITPNYFTLLNLGEFYDNTNPTEAPFSPAALPDTVTIEMAQVFISDFVLNSASYVLFTEGQMATIITDSQLPPDAPLRLNTTYFTDLIPPLEKAYPNQMFELGIRALEVPTGQFTPSGAFVTALGALDCIMLPNHEIAFTMGVKLLTSGSAAMNGLNITGQLIFLNTTLSLINSTIGEFNVSNLQSIVDDLVQAAVIPEGNKILGAGFPLPSVQGLTFISPTIGWGTDYLYVSTDVNYIVPGAGEEEDTKPETGLKAIKVVE